MPDMSNSNVSSSSLTSNSVSGVVPSRLSLIKEATVRVVSAMSQADRLNPELVEASVLSECHLAIGLANVGREKGDKYKQITELLPSQIADILMMTYPIVSIAAAGLNSDPMQDLIAVYQPDGDNAGIYENSELAFRQLIRRYNYSITSRDVEEVIVALREQAPRVPLCQKENLVAVNNGIFDYDTKQLLAFDPKYVFLSKSRVNYNPNAQNVVIHNPADDTDWDVESWMQELSDDPEVVNVLWQVLGAIIRPLVPWNLSAWFYSESGNNGKGTLCELMRQLCGSGSYATIPLSDFGKDFMLEPLIRASAIIVDENDVGTFIDKAANLKAVVTGDSLTINRKFRSPVAFSFHGFMVQCLNEMPRIKDKSDSFFRRQLFIPFTKCFTGSERKYIKHDYLHRRDVLEYVMYRVLNMDYYSLDVPQSCQDALEEYKTFVDPIRMFLSEIMPKVKWDLLPFTFLYDLYVAWYKATEGSDRNIKSRPTFIKEVRQIVMTTYPKWDVVPDKTPMRIGNRMADAEPLIMDFHLDNWFNPRYKASGDVNLACHPVLSSHYRGIFRRDRQNGSDEDVAAVVTVGDDDDDEVINVDT